MRHVRDPVAPNPHGFDALDLLERPFSRHRNRVLRVAAAEGEQEEKVDRQGRILEAVIDLLA